jgi:hypothetical protein
MLGTAIATALDIRRQFGDGRQSLVGRVLDRAELDDAADREPGP